MLFLKKWLIFNRTFLKSTWSIFLFQSFCQDKTNFPKSTGFLNLFFRLISWFLSKLSLLSASFPTFPNLRKSYFSLNSSLWRLFCSTYSGAKPYFTDLVLFKLLVSFLMRWFYLILFFSRRSIALDLNSSFLISLILCSAANSTNNANSCTGNLHVELLI